jgi:trigger factor
MKTTVTELPESRVRVEAEVPPEEVERRVEQTARTLGKDLRIPGFRKGKVPAAVVVRRIGREAVLEETIRTALGRWYVEAIDASGIAPVGDPDLQMGENLPGPGEPLTFSIEIGVRPTATLGEYMGLEVGRREPAADDEAIDKEVEALRERASRLETVEEPATTGDFVVMDYKGSIADVPFEGGRGARPAHRARLRPAHPRLRGAARRRGRGRRAQGRARLPRGLRRRAPRRPGRRLRGDRQGGQAQGAPRARRRLRRRGRRLRLARRAARDIRKRLEEADGQAVESEFREAVLDARWATRRWTCPTRSSRRAPRALRADASTRSRTAGIDSDTYLRIAGKTEEELLEEAKPDAEQALRATRSSTAIVDAEGIEVSDDEVISAAARRSRPADNAPTRRPSTACVARAPGLAQAGPRRAQGARAAGRRGQARRRRQGRRVHARILNGLKVGRTCADHPVRRTHAVGRLPGRIRADEAKLSGGS